MDKLKRKRGRPKGASRLNPADDQALIQVATLVDAEAILPSTAMHRLGFPLESAGLRRLQRKWRAGSDRYLNQARAQQAARAEAARNAPTRPQQWLAELQRMAEVAEAVSRAISPALLRAAERMAVFSNHFGKLSNPQWAEKIALLETPTAKALQAYDARHLNLPALPSPKWQEAVDRVSKIYGSPAGLTNLGKFS